MPGSGIEGHVDDPNPARQALELNFGSGACTVKTIRVVQGALSATVPVSDLLTALGAKAGGNEYHRD